MSQPPQNWGPAGAPQPGPAHPPQGQPPGFAPGGQPGPSAHSGPHGQPGPFPQPGPYAQPGQPGSAGPVGPPNAYPPGPGYGPPPAQGGPPKKKSKLPLILGISAAVLLLLVGGGVIALSTLFRAPTMPVDRTIMIFEPPGVQLGSTSLTTAKKSTSTFGNSEACSKKLTAATQGSDSLVTVDNDQAGANALAGRTADAKGTDAVFDALSTEMKECVAPNYTVRSKGANIGSANGATYREFTLQQPKSRTNPTSDLLLLKYGNTWAVVISKPGVVTDPADVAKSFAARVKAAAK